MLYETMVEAENRMRGAIKSLEGDLAAYRTGRASPALLDRVKVEAYGVEVTMQQVATISVPDAQTLAIRPYDANNLSQIERAILKSDIGITPNNDGKIIRLVMPRLTEERRRDLTKVVHRRVEEARVAVRNVRRDTLNDIREMESEKIITEDDRDSGIEDLQRLTDRYIEEVNTIGQAKEEEIMEV